MFKTALNRSRHLVVPGRPALSFINPNNTVHHHHHSNNNNTTGTATATANDVQKRFRSDANIRYKFIMSPEMSEKLQEYIKRVGAQQIGSTETAEEVYYDYSPQKAGQEGQQQQQRETAESAPVIRKHGELNTEDRSPFALTKQDIWLQTHNGKWVCRAPDKDDITKKTHLATPLEERVPNYRTLVGERDIRIELNLQQDTLDKANLKTMEQSLTERGMLPFAKIKTESTKYQMPDEFIVEMIKTDFGYNSGVLSLYIRQARERDLEQAGQKLHKLIQDVGIEHTDFCPTPIVEYIYRNDKDHYRVLTRADIVQERKTE